jgi:hypothetical protein
LRWITFYSTVLRRDKLRKEKKWIHSWPLNYCVYFRTGRRWTCTSAYLRFNIILTNLISKRYMWHVWRSHDNLPLKRHRRQYRNIRKNQFFYFFVKIQYLIGEISILTFLLSVHQYSHHHHGLPQHLLSLCCNHQLLVL